MKQEAIPLPDGTEVIKSKESRRKIRRWTYVADVQMVLPKKNDDGTTGEVRLPIQRINLESVTYCDAKEAREEVKHQTESLRKVNPFFAKADIHVMAKPHETISMETYKQLNGYRDMAMILDKALELCIKEAQDIVAGHSLGAAFVEREAVAADPDKGIEAKPAITNITIKEGFYAEAVKLLKARMEAQNEQQVAQADTQSDSAESTTDEHREFVPEIVEIQRAPKAEQECPTTQN